MSDDNGPEFERLLDEYCGGHHGQCNSRRGRRCDCYNANSRQELKPLLTCLIAWHRQQARDEGLALRVAAEHVEKVLNEWRRFNRIDGEDLLTAHDELTKALAVPDAASRSET